MDSSKWESDLSRYADLKSLTHMLDEQIKKSPDDVALVADSDGVSLTFRELGEATEILARWLIEKGVVKDSAVAIYMGRTVEYVISYIAILKAGGAYLPLDISYPSNLVDDVILDAKPVAAIASTVTIEKLKGKMTHIAVLDGDWKQRLSMEIKAKDRAFPTVDIDDLACYVYSSGTTGKPKGIMLPHRACVFSYYLRHLILPFQSDDRVASNVFFTWELLRPLLKGIPLYVIPDTTIYDPMLLTQYLQRNSITRILFTPSLLEAVLDSEYTSRLKSLRAVWLCGEVVTTSLLERANQLLPWVKFYNLYSISECHDVAISDLNEFWSANSATDGAQKEKFAPVGKVVPGVHLQILDENMISQPVGMPGEIFIGGPTLARGYLNLPEVNKKRFIQLPDKNNTMRTFYRTGDWGLVKSDGSLEICGRCDSMVKIRGYSIEVQAVESALIQLQDVNTCAVLAVGEEGEDKQLVAYVVPNNDVTRKELRQTLKTMLPFYMIPSYFIFLKTLPLLKATGKLNKKDLPPITKGLEEEDNDIESLSKTEQLIRKVFCELLKMDFVDIHESFFDLGGHSLLAARLVGKLRNDFEMQIDMQELFQYPSVFQLAKYIDAGKDRNQINAKSLDLRSEVTIHSAGQPSIDMQLRAFWRSQHYGNKLRRVLLTGATGFLGAYVLKELLLQTKVEVYCLVRKSPDSAKTNRLKKNLEFYEILKTSGDGSSKFEKEFEKRVHVMEGDVALVEMGLRPEDYTFLSYEIDYIIHAAAFVNLVFPYEALKGANVLGTKNVLIFSRNGKIKPLHYISSNAVLSNNKVDCKEEPVPYSESILMENGYSQSKWVAEQLLLKGVSQGLPISIYRIGNISADQTNAGWNPSDFILLVMRASLMTSSWPDIPWQVEMTPVDFVSQAIVKLSRDQHSAQKIYHIVQPNHVTGRQLFKWLKEDCGHKLELTPFDDWCRKVEQLSEKNIPAGHPSVIKMLSTITMNKDPSLFAYNTTFDISNLTTSLSSHGLKYPDLNSNLIHSYVNNLSRRKVFPQPTQKGIFGSMHGKVVIVTGASSGIGRETSRLFYQNGAKICIAARSIGQLTNLQQELGGDTDRIAVCKCDVTNEQQVKDMVSTCVQKLGPVDILVNNAGVMYYQHMSNIMTSDWMKMIDVNCKGVLHCIGAVIPHMIERKSGQIINLSSNAGIRGFPGLSVYSGTKFFVEGLSQGLRHEMSPHGIKVCLIKPGDVKTNIAVDNQADSEAQKEYDCTTKMDILLPQDVAKAIVFVASQPDYCGLNEITIEPREGFV